MKVRAFIINKAATRRITRVYLPFFVAIFLLLQGAVLLTNRPPAPPLNLGQDFSGKIPIVYNDNYNIGFFGLERFHPFDSAKYGKIVNILLSRNAIDRSKLIDAAPPGDDLLHLAHSDEYLTSLQSSWTLARIAELPFLRFFPSRLSRNVVLEPMLYQMGGSLLAAKAALKFGWAVNLGGGFHHASYDNGQGFCALADISLIIKYLRREKIAQKFMIVDLDAHQGNGYERDFNKDDDVYIMDVYNKDVYPNDTYAKQGIDLKVELDAFAADKEYFSKVEPALDKAFTDFKPDLVIYNAGTDLMSGDPIGALDVSPAGIVKRDEMVFRRAFDRKIPVVMLLSGGYQKSNAAVIADSLLNLKKKFQLF